jgi:hypothetical protein
MSKLLDGGVVALALCLAVGYVLFSLGPKTLRRRLWSALAHAAASAPPALHLRAIARRLDGTAMKVSGGCGGCESCGPEPSAAPGHAPEVRVAIESIGRRRG